MAAARTRRRRPVEENENEDRWLLTYADMITLLLVMFMVLFSISSVNVSKFEGFKRAVQVAFSGQVLPGGPNIQQTGGSHAPSPRASPEPVVPALKPFIGERPTKDGAMAAQREEEDFRELKRRIDAYAREHGLERRLETEVARRGLVVRLLTDKVLFDSGSAELKPRSGALLSELARLLKFEVRHPILVEGHTDDVRISSARFPTNWELSTGRAARVVRALIDEGVGRGRLGAAGYGAQHPIASNARDSGRRRNRRVEIVLLRLNRTAP